jgi:hypothetical protein
MESQYSIVMDTEAIDQKYEELIKMIADKCQAAAEATNEDKSSVELIHKTLKIIQNRIFKEMEAVENSIKIYGLDK